MDSIINLQKKIVPELTDLLVLRYQILRQVSHEHPIGRRALAARLGLSERVLRAQVDFLKGCGLLVFSSAGMTVTEEGMDILKELADYVRKLQGLNSLEQLLCGKLNIGRVVIIPGDSDQEEVVKREIGRAAARILSRLLSDGKKHIVAVSGGTTMAALAANVSGSHPQTVVVPARGGLGDNVELQANTIATVLAQRMGASYRQLYVPDSVSEEILNSILAEDTGVKAVGPRRGAGLRYGKASPHGAGVYTKTFGRRCGWRSVWPVLRLRRQAGLHDEQRRPDVTGFAEHWHCYRRGRRQQQG